jgi:hypothetical protein
MRTLTSISQSCLGIAALASVSLATVGSSTVARAATRSDAVSAATTACSTSFRKVAAPPASELLGATAISDSEAWAVGYDKKLAVTEHWNGTTWTSVPNPAFTHSVDLLGVSEVSSDDVWAVGDTRGGAVLIEQWLGSAWSVVASPKLPGTAVLSSVSAISAGSAWAAGYEYVAGGPAGGYVPLLEHWNGTNWTVSQVTSTGTLSGIAEISANDVWAVGQATIPGAGGTFTTGALLLHWNGIGWTQFASPDADGQLRSVSASSSSDVWAVGDGLTSALIEHWNGATWSIAANPSPADGSLRSVVAQSPTDAWAVGDYSPGPGTVRDTLVEHWNGLSWTAVRSASAAGRTNYVFAVAGASSGTNVWAVGSSQSSASPRGTTERACQ